MQKSSAVFFCAMCVFGLSTRILYGQETVLPDSTQSHLFLVADSLNAQYAGRDGLEINGPPVQGIRGRLQFGRSLTPLNHFGDNIYKPVIETPELINAIRQLKSDGTWSPYTPGQIGSDTYDYHYNQDGGEKTSSYARVYLEYPLNANRRTGIKLNGQFEDDWGPFPNQRTSNLAGLGQFTFQMTPSYLLSLSILGRDNGWHTNKGNKVFTDRARYMLEKLNSWRARTGGVEITLANTSPSSTSYRIFGRFLMRQWASDPPDTNQLRNPTPGDTLPQIQPLPVGLISESDAYVNGVYPVVNTAISATQRSIRSIEVGAEVNIKVGGTNRLILGIETQFRRQNHYQHWQTATLLDRSDVTIHPGELSFYFSNQFRFWALMMGLGLRYDLYNPGEASWADVYQTAVDSRVIRESGRQLLITTGGFSKTTHLLNPHFSLAYPSGIFTAHFNFSITSRSTPLAAYFNPGNGSPFSDQTIPTLLPRRKTSMETGIGLNKPDYTMDFTFFYRDTERYEPLFGPDILPQSVSNYASSWGRIDPGLQKQKGIEAVYVRRSKPIRRSGIRFSGGLSYMYLFDIGDIRRRDLPIRPQAPILPGDLTTFDGETNTYWNRRHWLAVSSSIRLKSGTTLTTIGQFQSGVPYSGTNQGVSGTLNQVVRFGPWLRKIDARIDVPIRFGKKTRALLFFIEGRNITNHRIIEAITDPGTFGNSGQPDNNTVAQQQWVYGPARSVWTGFGFNW